MRHFIVLYTRGGISTAGVRLLGGRCRHALLGLTLLAGAYQLQIIIVDLLVETEPNTASVGR